MARNRGEDQELAVLYGNAPKSVKSALKGKLDQGLEMTTDVGQRVLKYADENLPDAHAVSAKVKDLIGSSKELIDSGEVGAKVKGLIGSGKELLGSGSAKVSGLFGRFIKRK